MFLPKVSSWRRLPLRKPSPTPARRSSDPTPQAMPNMVRNERSLCAHSVRRVWLKMSSSMRISTPVRSGAGNLARRPSTCCYAIRLAVTAIVSGDSKECRTVGWFKFAEERATWGEEARADRWPSASLLSTQLSIYMGARFRSYENPDYPAATVQTLAPPNLSRDGLPGHDPMTT